MLLVSGVVGVVFNKHTLHRGKKYKKISNNITNLDISLQSKSKGYISRSKSHSFRENTHTEHTHTEHTHTEHTHTPQGGGDVATKESRTNESCIKDSSTFLSKDSVCVDGWTVTEAMSLASIVRLLCSNEDAKFNFLNTVGFDVLMTLCGHHNPQVLEQCAWAIGALATDPKSEILAVESGVLEALQSFLKLPHAALTRRTQWAMSVFSDEARSHWELLKQKHVMKRR
eukprot:GHVR01005633.1.p1 GENE.GHVR01005633.1~~GHVR01005633.1.p1  ORF type:complete len:228 (+),score=65.52 GHVR01005633.1:76-759(+)